jgi:coenzyme F420-reducing hydrogenase delta subunit
VIFCCEKTPTPGAIALRCLAMLPPSVVEYALRRGARKVTAVGCEGECAYRLGMELCDERFAARREPHLRATVRSSRRNNEYSFVLR